MSITHVPPPIVFPFEERMIKSVFGVLAPSNRTVIPFCIFMKRVDVTLKMRDCAESLATSFARLWLLMVPHMMTSLNQSTL
jgi:hypothetical protein